MHDTKMNDVDRRFGPAGEERFAEEADRPRPGELQGLDRRVRKDHNISNDFGYVESAARYFVRPERDRSRPA